MIYGIGVDTVDIDRFSRQLERTPSLRERLFCETERELPIASLAARFAAKEALMKALRGSHHLSWHDMEIVRDEQRAPSFAPGGVLTDLLATLGAGHTHLSITHDGGVAPAFVIVEAAEGGGAS